MKTRDKLLLHARRQFWANGYSNVSLRQIASAAGVDVALISRHFGGKLGLFEATLDGAFSIFETPPVNETELIDAFVRIFAEAPRTSTEPSAVTMLLTNSYDEEVGSLIRDLYDRHFQQTLRDLLGPERAALFAAVVFGFSVAEKSLRVDGIAPPSSVEYRRQLEHLIRSALSFSG
ncbi:MAG: TetR family transcriptional regulator [Pseudomonadota bacterium]